MIFDIITLFPDFFSSPFEESLLKKAQEKGLLQINITDLRPFGEGKHHITDDSPFGGEAGMVMMAEPIAKAVEHILEDASLPASKHERNQSDTLVILLTPQGKKLDQKLAAELARKKKLILICGRYEGVDERVASEIADMELSIGDYVLGGGESAAMVVVEVVSRLVPGVVGNTDSVEQDSFPDLLKHPQYTRPANWRGMDVPAVLISGDHEKIRLWRRKQSLERTLERRPDLLNANANLTEEDRKLLEEIKNEK